MLREKKMPTVSNTFKGEKLGTYWRTQNKKGTYILRQLPITKSSYEPRVRYLLNLDDPQDVILKVKSKNDWFQMEKPR